MYNTPTGYRETACRLRERYGAELLTIAQASAELNIDKRTILSRKLVPTRRTGRTGHIYVSVNDLALYLTRIPVCGTRASGW